MKRSPLSILVLASGAIAALAEEAADESEEAPETVCVNKRNINSIDEIDDQHIYARIFSAEPR